MGGVEKFFDGRGRGRSHGGGRMEVVDRGEAEGLVGSCSLEEIGGIEGRSVASGLGSKGREGGREVRKAPIL